MTERQIRFSVIIPVYNSGKYLADCLDSILKQTYTDYEIVAVDDGSMDDSFEVLKSYEKKYPFIRAYRQENKGPAAARACAARKCKGDYLIPIDSDDWLSSERLFSDVSGAIDEYGPQILSYGIFHGENMQDFGDFRGRGYYSREEMEGQIYPRLILDRKMQCFHPRICGGVYSKSLFLDNLLYSPGATYAEDQASFISCFYHADSYYAMDGSYYVYRPVSASITHKGKALNWNWPYAVNKHIADHVDLDHADFREQMDRKVTNDFWIDAMSQFYRVGQGEEYRAVKKDITEHLKKEPFHSCVRRARFQFLTTGWIKKIILKHRLIGIMRFLFIHH